MAACLPCLVSLLLLEQRSRAAILEPPGLALPAPEEMTEVSLRLCPPAEPKGSGDYRILPAEEELTWCLSLTTDKDQKPRPGNPPLFSRFGASVYVTYAAVELENSGIACQMKFDGYRGTYSISPDFGAYPECQNVYAAQRHALATNTALSMPKNPDCPILDLPADAEAYRACRIPSNTWLHLHFRSRLSYQLRNHSRVERFLDAERLMSTHTSTRHDPDRLTTPYLQYLRTESGSCYQSVVLARDQRLPSSKPLSFRVEHRIRQGSTERSESLGQHRLDSKPWVKLDFSLVRGNDTEQSLCLHDLTTEIGNSTVKLSRSHCYPLDTSTCGASSNSAFSCLLLIALTLLRLC